MRKRDPYPDDIIFGTAELFLGNPDLTVEQIATTVNARFQPDPPLNRTDPFRLLRQAAKKHWVMLSPPISQAFGKEIADKFDLPHDAVHIVNTRPETSDDEPRAVEGTAKNATATPTIEAADDAVATRTAELVVRGLRLLRHRSRQPVGLGLGPGAATRAFCRMLVRLLALEHDLPKLKLFAISAGCPPDLPQLTPISFFNLFPPEMVDSRRALLTKPLLLAGSYDEAKKDLGLEESFSERDQIKIIVTSMGDLEDKHDLLRKLLIRAKVKPQRWKTWIGNVQYRPYAADHAISEGPKDLRVATLFELNDLVDLALRRDRHVILMARQCRVCKMNRARALRPLLEYHRLRVFSEVVMDVASARPLLDKTPAPPGNG